MIAILLIIGFGFRLGVDYFKYDTYNGSASFSVFIIEMVLEFLISGIIMFAIVRIVRKEYTK